MLITFFDANGIIRKEFVPEGQTVNAELYCEVLKRLLRRICRVRPQFAEPGSWFLLHDNARPHVAVRVKRFLATHQVIELNHPPCSPDLAPTRLLSLSETEIRTERTHIF
jgi:[histone H3]-lysine36 N-dimethyltransferase SETMAR